MTALSPRPLLRKPDTAFEWALHVTAWAAAVSIPLALVVFMWPVITAAGAFSAAVFCLALATGLVISTVFLWLFAPLAFVLAALATGLSGTARSLWRRCHR